MLNHMGARTFAWGEEVIPSQDTLTTGNHLLIVVYLGDWISLLVGLSVFDWLTLRYLI